MNGQTERVQQCSAGVADNNKVADWLLLLTEKCEVLGVGTEIAIRH